MGEVVTTALLCLLLDGGTTEVRHHFGSLGAPAHIRVDCETPTHVIEATLDNTASGRDSVHQAILAELLTGKPAVVVVIDRDGREDRYQQELRLVTSALGIPFALCSQGFIERWAATRSWRAAVLGDGTDDLPTGAAALHCDLGRALGRPLLN